MFNFDQCLEFFPESEEIEYRLAGVNLKLQNINEGIKHLKTALQLNYDYNFILEELFPNIYKRPSVAKFITQFKKSSS